MKKFTLFSIVLIILMVSGCTQAPIENVGPTESIKEATQTATATAIPTQTPEPKPTPKPTQTPEPTASPSPTPPPELNLPDNFFGSGGMSAYDTHVNIAQDDEQNIYYVRNFKTVVKIDAKDGSTSVFLTAEEIGDGYIFGVDIINGKLYVKFEPKNADYKFGFYDVEKSEMIELSSHVSYYKFGTILMFDNMIYKDDFYDATTGESITIDSLYKEFDGDSTEVYGRYKSDDYVIFERIIKEGDYSDPIIKRRLYFVDINTYEVLGTINSDLITTDSFEILHCEGNEMYLVSYDEKYNRQVFEKYNIQTGKLATLHAFTEGRRIIKYNPRSHDLYFSYGANYTHINYSEGYPHEYSDQCLSAVGKETGVQRFLKVNIDTKETEQLNEIPIWEYIQGEECLSLMCPYLYGNFMLVYHIGSEERWEPDNFHSRFYLGSEIDYDTWRD